MQETTLTLATPANMRRAEEAQRNVFAVSLTDPWERYSATPGDYWDHPDDEPLRDSEGEPMVLAVERVQLLDALTDELL